MNKKSLSFYKCTTDTSSAQSTVILKVIERFQRQNFQSIFWGLTFFLPKIQKKSSISWCVQLHTISLLLLRDKLLYRVSLTTTCTTTFSCLFFADQAHNVTIHNKDMSLRGGTQHEFTCEALGSRPAAVITWWLDDLQIQPQVDNIQIVRTKQGFLQLLTD